MLWYKLCGLHLPKKIQKKPTIDGAEEKVLEKVMELVESTKNEPDSPKSTTNMLLASYVNLIENPGHIKQMILLNMDVTNLYMGK